MAKTYRLHTVRFFSCGTDVPYEWITTFCSNKEFFRKLDKFRSKHCLYAYEWDYEVLS